MLYYLCIFVLLHLQFGVSTKLPDWLVTKINIVSAIEELDLHTIRISNGLIARDFTFVPDFATIDFYSFEREKSLIRAISPEAVICIAGTYYNVGGFLTSAPRGYLNRTALKEDMRLDPQAFHFDSFEIREPIARYKYTPARFAPTDIEWPPKGIRFDVFFTAPSSAPYLHQQVIVAIHYEMYDNIPLLAKWVSIHYKPGYEGKIPVFVNSVEYMAVNWEWSPMGYGWLHIENDVPGTGGQVNWFWDQANTMPGSFQTNVNCSYHEQSLVTSVEPFESFRVHLLVVGSSDPERFGLAVRKKLRLLAPQIQESPIFFHMVLAGSELVRKVIDQMAQVGFEMMIYSFGSGFDLESDNESYIQQVAADIAYARSKGIEVGGYDLIAWTRTVPSYWQDLDNGSNQGACIASGWYDYLVSRALNFINRTGLSMLETDGPWGGYHCDSTNHSHHKGRSDSLYWQLTYQARFMMIMRELGMYINQPDLYFYYGGNKAAMGYDENQYSLPRWQDLSVSRQGMYDDMFHYTPTVGWMFLPLVVYHGGGPDAIFEPLKDHLTEYNFALAQYFGAGVMACYRGVRLWDSPEVFSVVSRWVQFYKKYRAILTSDIIHVRRADMQDIDSFMHVNPDLEIRALAMVFNPTNEVQKLNLTLPLYYSGLTDVAQVSHEEGNPVQYTLDRFFHIDVYVELGPLNVTWYKIQ